MTNDEKRATGIHHHQETDYSNPVHMNFRGIHITLVTVMTIIFLIVYFLSK